MAARRKKAVQKRVKKTERRLKPKITIDYLYRGGKLPEKHAQAKRALGHFGAAILLAIAFTGFYDGIYYGSATAYAAGTANLADPTVFLGVGVAALALALFAALYARSRRI